MKRIVDCASGEVTDRELNKAEKDQQKVDEIAIQAGEAEAEAKAQAKAALLNKLGITVEEAALLLS